jgi:hypothetical protein
MVANVAPVTVKGIVFVVPIGVVRPMLWIPTVAVVEIARLAVTVVSLTTFRVPATSVTPVPSPVKPVVPFRLDPANITGSTAVPRSPVFGLIEVSVGPCTVKGTVLLVPPTVVTLTALGAVSAAVVEMVKVALMVSGLTTLRPLTVIPPPGTLIPVTPIKSVPVSVTGTVVPRIPVGGAIEVRLAAGGVTTVKVTALLVPPPVGVVTVTLLGVAPAPFAIVNVAVTVSGLPPVPGVTVMPLTVTPPPGTLTAVVPVRPVPTRVTGTVLPR